MAYDAAVWFVIIRGQQAGPLSRAEVGLEFATGDIDAESLVWRHGMGGWLPAAQAPELASLFVPPPPPAVPPPPPVVPPQPPAAAAEAEPADDRTRIEMLPLGERVHQEEVASKLFDAVPEPTVSSRPLDLSRWEPPGKAAVKPSPQPARPEAPQAAARPAALVALLLLGAALVVAVLVFLLG
jgi:GYF domain 2